MRTNAPAPLNDFLLLDVEFDELGEDSPLEETGHLEFEDEWNDELLLGKA